MRRVAVAMHIAELNLYRSGSARSGHGMRRLLAIRLDRLGGAWVAAAMQLSHVHQRGVNGIVASLFNSPYN